MGLDVTDQLRDWDEVCVMHVSMYVHNYDREYARA